MVKHFLLPLMKRKNNRWNKVDERHFKLNEAVQIPYRLQDFKANDRVHIIGIFDDVEFDATGTIVVTSKDVDNPYSTDDSFLLAFDEPQQLSHNGDTGIDWIRNRCQNKCWWVYLFQFNPDYNYDDYNIDYNKNRVIKIGEALPDAYDVISSLYESTDLIKENVIYPGIKVGDEVIVSLADEGITYGPIIDKFATVVSVTEGGTLLVKIKNFNKGHNGNHNIHCGERDCLFLNGSWYEKLIIRPAESLGMPDAYDVISSLYESEDFDWASDMASDISKNIITPGQYYRINGKLAHHPFYDTIDLYIKEVFPEHNYVIFDIISSDPNWVKNNERISLRTVITLIDTKYWYPISKEESLFDKNHDIILDESEDLEWASDMVNDVVLNSATMSVITQIPTTVDPVRFHYIGFKGPGITEKDIADVVWFTENNTNYKPFVDAANTIHSTYGYYLRNGSAYIVLKPNSQKSIGSSPNAFEIINKVKINNPKEVNVIKFIADK